MKGFPIGYSYKLISKMEKEHLVSVIIPVYNREKFIAGCINSVLNQTYKNWELIVVDDRSTDKTTKIIKEYEKKHQKIKYVKNTHLKGPAGARNQGLEFAKGEYIAFLDSDNEWANFHVKEVVKELKKNPYVDWIFTDFKVIKDKKTVIKSIFSKFWKRKAKFQVKKNKKLNIMKGKNLFDLALNDFPAYFGTSIIKKKVFDKIKLDESLYVAEDQLFRKEAVAKGIKLAYLENIHLKSFIHDENISQCNKSKDYKKKIMVYTHLEKHYFKLKQRVRLTKKQKKIIKKNLSEIYFWRLAYNTYLKNKNYKNTNKYFRKGLKLRPLNLIYWKTYIIFKIKNILRKIT